MSFDDPRGRRSARGDAERTALQTAIRVSVWPFVDVAGWEPGPRIFSLGTAGESRAGALFWERSVEEHAHIVCAMSATNGTCRRRQENNRCIGGCRYSILPLPPFPPTVGGPEPRMF